MSALRQVDPTAARVGIRVDPHKLAVLDRPVGRLGLDVALGLDALRQAERLREYAADMVHVLAARLR